MQSTIQCLIYTSVTLKTKLFYTWQRFLLVDRWREKFAPSQRLDGANSSRQRTTKETVEAIIMLYRNTKVKVRSPDGDTDYFDIVARELQGDTLAPYLFIICLDYVLRTSIDKVKENGFKLTKERSRRYPAKNNYQRGLCR